MQAGQLERRYWYLPGTSEKHHSCKTKVRCSTHIHLAQLKTAYQEFNTKQISGLVTTAAQSHDSAPHQAAQDDHLNAPKHRQMPAPGLSQPALHTSASAGAIDGMAPPAYATQMDGPNDEINALADSATSSADEPTSLSCHAAARLQESGDKRDQAASPVSDAAPAKKAKSGKLQTNKSEPPMLRGLGKPARQACKTAANHRQHFHLLDHSKCLIGHLLSTGICQPLRSSASAITYNFATRAIIQLPEHLTPAF